MAHAVNLIIYSGTAQYWDGTGRSGDNLISGGAGTWNATTSNWTTSTGGTNSTWQSDTAVFAATGGTVALGAPISAQGLIFGSTGYTISGTSANALTLHGGHTRTTISVTARRNQRHDWRAHHGHGRADRQWGRNSHSDQYGEQLYRKHDDY